MSHETDGSAEEAERERLEAFRARLRLLIREHGGSQAQFAKRCGIDPPRVTAWLKGERHPKRDKKANTNGAAKPIPHQPRYEHLVKVAIACEVSLDWLVVGVGLDNQPSAEPVYRGQQRTDAKLKADLAAYVLRVLRGRGVDLGTATARDINGWRLLADAVQSVASYAGRQRAMVDATMAAQFERVLLKELVDDPSPALRDMTREFLASHAPPAQQIPEMLKGPHYLNGAALVSDPRAQGVARRTTQT